MRITQRVLSSAAAAGVALFAAACVVPPAGLAPRPDELAYAAPDVAFYSFDSEPYNTGSGLLSYSTTRDAYTTVFEVDQRGRVWVLNPSASDAENVAKGGQSYVVYPRVTTTDPQFLGAGRDFNRIPYVFALTSELPLDLRDFGRGQERSRPVSIGDGYEPDSVIARVADRVLPGGADYASDYAYVGPNVGPAGRALLADCGRPVTDVHDYRYFREQWAVFDLQDQRFSYNPAWLFSPTLGATEYSYAVLPIAAYRAQIATTAFYGSCGSAPVLSSYAARSAFGYYGDPNFAYGYPYAGSYGFATNPYGGYYGGWAVATTPQPRPVQPLRPPRVPLSFTDPVTVAAGPNAKPAPNALAPRTGQWLIRRVPGEGRQPLGTQTALGARIFGSGRQPGELQGGGRPGFAYSNGAAALGGTAAHRPAGVGYSGRPGGSTAYRPSGGSGHATGTSAGATASHAASGSSSAGSAATSGAGARSASPAHR